MIAGDANPSRCQVDATGDPEAMPAHANQRRSALSARGPPCHHNRHNRRHTATVATMQPDATHSG
jgi:hypothetical protein